MILDGSFAAVETGAACAAAAFALEFCFTKGWVQRCVDGVYDQHFEVLHEVDIQKTSANTNQHALGHLEDQREH